MGEWIKENYCWRMMNFFSTPVSINTNNIFYQTWCSKKKPSLTLTLLLLFFTRILQRQLFNSILPTLLILQRQDQLNCSTWKGFGEKRNNTKYVPKKLYKCLLHSRPPRKCGWLWAFQGILQTQPPAATKRM